VLDELAKLTIGQDPVFGPEKPTERRFSRDIKNTTSSASLEYFHYDSQNFGLPNSIRKNIVDDAKVFSVTQEMVVDEILSVRVQKSLRGSAGSFSVELAPTTSWRNKISVGDWCIIRLFNTPSKEYDSKKDIVMVGNVDRVHRTKQRDENTDKIIVRYTIEGRDFGKVFEDTTIWFNPYSVENVLIRNVYGMLKENGLILKGSPDELLKSVLNVFIGNGQLERPAFDGKKSLPPMEQWFLPEELFTKFTPAVVSTGAGAKTINEVLFRHIPDGLAGYKNYNAFGENETLWSQVQKSSNEIINDVFLDLDADKNMAIFLQPRPVSPFFEDPKGFLGDHHTTLVNMENRVEVKGHEVKYSNLGRDDQARFNFFWLNPRTLLFDSQLETTAFIDAQKGKWGNPMTQVESIKRYGLRQDNRILEFVYTDEDGSLNLNNALFESIMSVLYDINVYNHLYETGTITIAGRNDIRLGTPVVVESEYDEKNDKIYYIEGYSHEWTFPSQWETEISVTCGQWLDEGYPFIDVSSDDYGREDTDYLADSSKTKIDRSGREK